MRGPLLALLAALAPACNGPTPPDGVEVNLTVDVARKNTAITIDGEVVDPGGPTGHSFTAKTLYGSWDEAMAAAPSTVTATEGGATLGSIDVLAGRCVAQCAIDGCDPTTVKYEWSQVQVSGDGTVAIGCLRCESTGSRVGGDCGR